MTLKAYLSQAIKLDRAIDSAILQLEEWRCFSLKSQSFLKSSKNSAAKRSSVEQTVMKIALMEEQINRDIDRYVDLRNEIKGLIYLLDNPEEGAVLERHYLLGQTWDMVAKECYVCLRTVHYLHNKALSKLEPHYYEKKQKQTVS